MSSKVECASAGNGRSFLVYAVSAVGLLINQLVLYLLVDQVGAELMLSKFTAVTVFLELLYAEQLRVRAVLRGEPLSLA